jgi:meiotically up-regulated gene 157 (Mug157) protein
LDWRYDLNRLCWPMELSWMVWHENGTKTPTTLSR